ncbi:flagellar protein, FliL [Methanobrevibacter sp.]|uniref:flagellar protein, FliL n=1 Tax=Methanobrevibacter sp. TaxID=66852 RepID=UPI0038904A77
MKNFILVLLGIIVALLIVGGAVGYTMMNDVADDSGSDDSTIEKIVDKVSNVASSESSDNASDDSDIVSEEVKFNAQNGEGYYREVTYKDGGFRQYDTETGELIGSSYDSDQDKLPSME